MQTNEQVGFGYLSTQFQPTEGLCRAFLASGSKLQFTLESISASWIAITTCLYFP